MSLSPLQFIIFGILAGVLIMLTLTWLAPMPISTTKKWGVDVPQWFSSQTKTITIAENGQPAHEFSAARLVHYEETMQTQIEAPRALVFKPGAPPWQLQADQGSAEHQGALEEMREIDLWGHVVIWRESDAQAPFTQVTTEFLQFFPTRKFYKNRCLGQFSLWKPFRFRSRRLTADLNTQQVKLLNNVQSQYIPEKNAQ